MYDTSIIGRNEKIWRSMGSFSNVGPIDLWTAALGSKRWGCSRQEEPGRVTRISYTTRQNHPGISLPMVQSENISVTILSLPKNKASSLHEK